MHIFKSKYLITKMNKDNLLQMEILQVFLTPFRFPWYALMPCPPSLKPELIFLILVMVLHSPGTQFLYSAVVGK